MMKAPIGLKAEVSQRSSLLSQLGIIGENHSALTGSNQFVRIETKAAQHSKTATTTPFRMNRTTPGEILGPMNFCRVFNNGKAMSFRQI